MYLAVERLGGDPSEPQEHVHVKSSNKGPQFGRPRMVPLYDKDGRLLKCKYDQ